MSLNGVLRTGLIQLRVLDLDKSVKHYTDILGLNEVCRTEDGRVCLKGYDEFQHHSLVLRLADEAGLDFAAFKVDTEETLNRIEKETEAFGYKVEHIPANSDQPGFGRRISVKICTGHTIQLYCDAKHAEQIPQLINPHIWTDPPRGMRCQKLDHMLLYGPNIAEAERYFTEVLGMYAPEVSNTPDGKRFAVWLTCSNRPHDVAFVEYEQPGKVHHIGFLLQDWCDVGNAADWMARYSVKRDIGPTRHAITRGQTIYLWDPSGNRNEVYAGGYIAYPDHPQRCWDVDQIGRGLFYYEGELIPSFLQIVT